MRSTKRNADCPPNTARRSFLAFGALAVAGSALAACTATEADADAAADGTETPHDTDIGFFTDMVMHHEQALAMCQRVLGRDNGESVQSLAAAIMGLATDEQMSSLATATGVAQGRLFLTLMRAHHEGGVHMAEMATENAAIANVGTTAERMATIQNYEIGIIDQMVATTYA